ncbi:hypothetical protein HKX69_15515 [Streptomyces argyrophyllae]|uniref:Uncharacterized protein n=1 Tax=Streptomyces argyrophylli TaxID=2726118 RepID=A0A6M4PHQ4_9ACTN|nr:hypothetical protein [Streptomyces argyrophyllae]QJS10735.1 hypothetical protein HKX69_15515 [Streptomyces argyrophyllae]
MSRQPARTPGVPERAPGAGRDASDSLSPREGWSRPAGQLEKTRLTNGTCEDDIALLAARLRPGAAPHSPTDN